MKIKKEIRVLNVSSHGRLFVCLGLAWMSGLLVPTMALATPGMPSAHSVPPAGAGSAELTSVNPAYAPGSHPRLVLGSTIRQHASPVVPKARTSPQKREANLPVVTTSAANVQVPDLPSANTPAPTTPVRAAPASAMPVLHEAPQTTTVEPIAMPTSAKSWHASAPSSLRQVAQSWAEQGGYQLVWDADYDYPIRASLDIRGGFVDAIGNLFDLYTFAERPLRVDLYQEQRLVRVQAGE